MQILKVLDCTPFQNEKSGQKKSVMGTVVTQLCGPDYTSNTKMATLLSARSNHVYLHIWCINQYQTCNIHNNGN